MPLALPVETWERIIDHLWSDPRTLRQCAVVCKAWQARSRFHLVARPILSNTRQVHRFARLLDEYPELRSRVQMVQMWPGGRGKPLMHLASFAASLATRLPALTELCIFHAEWNARTAHPKTFLHLSLFLSVTDLVLSRVAFPSPLILARLICALPSLTTLNFVELSFPTLPKSSDLPFARLQAPPIRTLKLDGPSDEVVTLLVERLHIGPRVERFFGGWADYSEDRLSDESMMSVLQSAGPALRRISLRLWRTSTAQSGSTGEFLGRCRVRTMT